MKEIMRDFPDSFESRRLLIRSPRPGDGREMHAAILESLDALLPWMAWAHHIGTEADTEENVRQAWVKFLARENLRLHLYLKGTETIVGSSGLHRIQWEIPSFEIGYWVRTRFEGQGYITEATARITRFAFEILGARRVEIRMDRRNIRSKAVPERLGFVLEGHLHNDSLGTDGSLRDTLIYARTSLEGLLEDER
ncbi:MAG: GNAT family N-acetyltransferase [Chloroflexi bacterium]|nr:GNAT family N-acetyltransferase [Chloroflexota bacterium]